MKRILLTALMLVLPGLAVAAPQCDSRDRVTALLAEEYGETRRAVGIAGEGAVMEFYAADATGTWSITVTLPDGLMCLMASGAGYEAVVEELELPANL